MATKIHINGEVVELELGRLPLHEALALQRKTGKTPPEIARALEAQDLEAVAALAWFILRYRMGKEDLTFEDVTEGRYEVDINSWRVEVDDAPDPTAAAGAATTSS